MDLNKVNSNGVKGREYKEDKGGFSVSEEDMNAFSQMLDKKSDKIADKSNDMVYSDKEEKKADAEKAKLSKNNLPDQKMSAGKELLYNASRDKSLLSLADKSAMGLNADGLTKAALMNGSMTNMAHISMEMAKHQEASKNALQSGLTKDVSKIKTETKSNPAGTANANASGETKQGNTESAFALKETAKAEKADAERSIKREEVIKQIINHVELKNFAGKSELTIKMNPEFLGSMKMRLMFEGDKVSAEFNTTSAEVRQALEESSEELSNALAENGVKVGKINVKLVDEIN